MSACLSVCLQVSGPVFFSSLVSEKLLRTHVTPPLDGCTYLGLDSGAPPLQVTPVNKDGSNPYFESLLLSSSDFPVPGRAEVSLLRCDSGPVCERGKNWLQFSSWTSGGDSEERQGRAVEDPKRNPPHCGWVTRNTTPTHTCFLLLDPDWL